MLEVWLKAKDKSRLISRSISRSRDCSTKSGSYHPYMTIALHFQNLKNTKKYYKQ